MISLPWLAYNLFFPISQVGKASIAVSTPTVNKTVWVPGLLNPETTIMRHASPEAVIMRVDPANPLSNETSTRETSRTTRAMERPPRSDTPFFNETTQFPHDLNLFHSLSARHQALTKYTTRALRKRDQIRNEGLAPRWTLVPMDREKPRITPGPCKDTTAMTQGVCKTSPILGGKRALRK